MIGVAAWGAFGCRDAHAYRPFDGTDADVADVGEFELELGPAHYFGRGKNHYLIAPATVLNFGFAPRLELVVDFRPFVGLEDVPQESRLRVLDTDVFVKYIIRRGTLQEAHGCSIAIEGGPLVPEIEGQTGFGAQANTIFSYRWPGGTVHFNEQVGVSRTGDLDLFSGVIIEGSHDLPLRPVAEVFAEHDFGAGTTLSALVGGIWSARESLAFDMGMRVARIEGAPATEVRLGFTWTIPVTGGEARAENARLLTHRSRSL
jgi:hypothetical protein